MTKDDIIRMAREAGAYWEHGDWNMQSAVRFDTEDDLRFFANLVAAHEREACAKVADDWVRAYEHPSKVIAETIRARGQA